MFLTKASYRVSSDSQQATLRNRWSEKCFPRWPWNFLLSQVSNTLISHQTPIGTDQWVSEESSSSHWPPPWALAWRTHGTINPADQEPSYWNIQAGWCFYRVLYMDKCTRLATEMAFLLIRGSASEAKRASCKPHLMQRAAIHLYLYSELWKSTLTNLRFKTEV